MLYVFIYSVRFYTIYFDHSLSSPLQLHLLSTSLPTEFHVLSP